MKNTSLIALLTVFCLLPSVGTPSARAAEPASAAAASAPITDQEIQQLVTQAQTLAQQLSPTQRQNISQRLAPRDFLSMEKQDMEKELNLPSGSQQAVTALQNGQLDKGPFAITNQELADLLVRFIPGIVQNTTSLNELQGTTAHCQEILELNAEPFLAGFIYLNRLFDFTMGTTNIRDVLFQRPQIFGKNVSTMDWILDVGLAGADWNYNIPTGKLAFKNAGASFRELFAQVTDAPTLPAFLEECRTRFMPESSLAEWFPTAGHALIAERHFASEAVSPEETSLYTKLANGGTAAQAHLLAMLTVPENSVYVISTPSSITYGLVEAYQERGASLNRKMRQTADEQMAFLDFWDRMLPPETDRHTMVRNIFVYDSLARYDQPHVGTSARWQNTRSTLPGMQDFFAPLGMCTNHMFSDAQASEGNDHNGTIRFWNVRALDERGSSTFSHELTHIFEDDVWMGQPRRDGMGGETYTRGLFETYSKDDEPVLNLNLLYAPGHDQDPQFRNSSPERFQSHQDLQTYMHGLFDVLYTLDYAEGEAALQLDTTGRLKWFHKFLQHPAEGKTYMTEEITFLTREEAEALHSVEDLVHHQIVAARYEIGGLTTVGTRAYNDYDVVPLFSANYTAEQNPNGISSGIMVRRYAHELLAEYGYYGGMVPYISNQYKSDAQQAGVSFSDSYILNRISNGQYQSMEEFRKDMLQRRYAQRDQLQPVSIIWRGRQVEIKSYDDLLALMQDAIARDLQLIPSVNMSQPSTRAFATNTETLKAAVFAAYLELTDEFRASIYRQAEVPIPPAEISSVDGDTIQIAMNMEGLTGTLILAGYDDTQQMVAVVTCPLAGTEQELRLQSPEIARADIQRVFVVDHSFTPVHRAEL